METRQGIPNVPKAIKNMLRPDEYVIMAVQQSRMRALVTPDSIFVTNLRIIKYLPSALGLRKAIEDYLYVDMANFKVKKGIVLATIEIRMRYSSNDLILNDLPKSKMDAISRVVNEGIRRAADKSNPQSTPTQQAVESQSDNPLQILKLRLAKGEISKEEFEDMKRLLQ